MNSFKIYQRGEVLICVKKPWLHTVIVGWDEPLLVGSNYYVTQQVGDKVYFVCSKKDMRYGYNSHFYVKEKLVRKCFMDIKKCRKKKLEKIESRK